MNIVIIDDEEAICFGLEYICTVKNHNVKIFNSYDNLKPIKETDLYICDHDIKKGNLSGSEWIIKYKKELNMANIVGMSGRDSWKNSNLKLLGILDKPFRLKTLEKYL